MKWYICMRGWTSGVVADNHDSVCRDRVIYTDDISLEEYISLWSHEIRTECEGYSKLRFEISAAPVAE